MNAESSRTELIEGLEAAAQALVDAKDDHIARLEAHVKALEVLAHEAVELIWDRRQIGSRDMAALNQWNRQSAQFLDRWDARPRCISATPHE